MYFYTRSFRSDRSMAIEHLECRRLLTAVDLSTVYSIAEDNFQSVDASVQFEPAGPLTITAGQTVTVQTQSQMPINVYCSDAGSTVIVDGVATAATAGTPTTYDYATGAPGVDAGTFVSLLAGMHTLSFTIVATDLPEGFTQSTASDGVTPLYSGPWAVANGTQSGNIFSSPLPFAIGGTNHLAFTQQPTNTAPNAAITPAMTVSVENASNTVLNDNDSVITLELDVANEILGSELTGTSNATMVDGVATFNNVSFSDEGTFLIVASAGGFQPIQTDNGPIDGDEPVGMNVASDLFKITTSRGGGGGGGGSPSLTATLAKSTLPASVIAGGPAHGTAVVDIANDGSGAEHSSATIDIYASTDNAVDNNLVLIGSTSKSLSIKKGKTAIISVPIKSLPATLDGSYTLLAQVTDTSGNTATSTTGPALTALPPFIAFSEALIKTTLAPSDISGQKNKATVQLKITNTGNISSTDKSAIAFYASLDTTATDGTLIRSVSEPIVIKPGSSKTVIISLQSLPAVSDGNYFLDVQVTDSKNDVTSVASGSTFALAAPFVSLVPGLGTTIISGSGKGTANAIFEMTNNGNVPSTSPTTINFYASTDGTLANATQVYTTQINTIFQPGKERKVIVKVPIAQTATLSGSDKVVLQVIDSAGGTQSEILPF